MCGRFGCREHQVEGGRQVLSAGLQELRHAGAKGRLHVGGDRGREQCGRSHAHIAAADEHVDSLSQRAPHKVVARRRVAWLQLVGWHAAAQQQQATVHELRAQVEGGGPGGGQIQCCTRVGIQTEGACGVSIMSRE
jgi:hypothetical protein